MNLRIAFFGSSLMSSYWNGTATYYRGIIRALAARGHRVTFFESDAFDRQQHRDMPNPSWAQAVVYSATEAGVAAALATARKADLVIKASGVGVFDALLEHEVAALRNAGTWTVFWDMDAPATLERLAHDPHDPFRALIPRYDLILTYGGGSPVVDAYRALRARDCVPIYNAFDPDIHYPVAPNPRFAADLNFLDSRQPDHDGHIGEFFFEPALRLPAMRFLLGGSGWTENAPQLSNVRYPGYVYPGDHNAFHCSARAVLNINRTGITRFGSSPPARVFEVAGAGACLITDHWRGLEQFLEPEREVLVAANGAEVAEQLAALDPIRARRIGAAALARVRAEHTYAHRAAELEQVLAAYTHTRCIA